MMTEALTKISNEFGLAFKFGERKSFNILVEHLPKTQSVLYHEGYINAPISQDQQGVFEETYNMTLYLLAPIVQAAKPDDHLRVINSLVGLAKQVLYRLDTNYILSNMSITENINFPTDRFLDATKLVVSAKPKLTTGYCLPVLVQPSTDPDNVL